MEFPRVLSPDPLCWAFDLTVVTIAIKCIRVGNPNFNVHREPDVERQFGHTNQDCNAEPLSIVQTSLVSTGRVNIPTPWSTSCKGLEAGRTDEISS